MPRRAEARRFTSFTFSRHTAFRLQCETPFFHMRCLERCAAVIAAADKRSEFASLTRTPRRH
ncbi:hypothetical protein WS68_01030 [Burkholderia sp. TSV86]|nr:hypothetical protein WS68_01030 [Burkholderia sp. TSV86]